MKKKVLMALVGSLCIMVFCSITVLAVKIEIIAPSAQERQFATQRDFYVIGKIDREGLDAATSPVNIEILLYKDDVEEPIRALRSTVGSDGVTYSNEIFLEYQEGMRYGTQDDEQFRLFAPPDLMYSGYDEDSFRDAWRKVMVRENYFAAIIYGGITQGFDSMYTDEFGTPYKDLTEGAYTLEVRALSSGDGSEVCRETIDITFGEEYDKIIYRGSPEKNVRNAAALSKSTSSRIFLDPFPGYWSPAMIFDTDETDVFYEIVKRWRPNNAVEYLTGHVNALLYNITDTCAAQTVELGSLVKNNRLSDVTFYCYDIGEPAITYSVIDKRLKASGALVPIEDGKSLKVNRVDRSPLTEDRNEIKLYEDSVYPDLNVADGVCVPVEKTISFYGVVTPIPVRSALVTEQDGAFTVNNRIERVSVQFYDGERAIAGAETTVALKRRFSEDYSQKARYEFKITASIPATAANKLLRARFTAKDTLGNTVEDAVDEVMLYASMSGETFTDYEDDAWYSPYCGYIEEMGCAIGGTRLNPSEEITRAQFAALINRAWSFAAMSDMQFADVANAWYDDDLRTAAQMGVVLGDENGNARPNETLSREEAIVMLARALNVEESENVFEFEDYEYISDWAQGAINAFAELGIVEGYGGYINAKAQMTVADAAALMCKTLAESAETVND
ncbi:MAG: S-layer homology domain-containing protein [Clostridia bacterium]|nr:S-layer homology domain-containing protein [Clostridia bacterium]